MTAQPPDTETTPLLGHGPRWTAPEPNGQIALPAIQSYLLRLQEQGISSPYEWCPDNLETEGARTAFKLLVLLVYKAALLQRNQSQQDLWEQWSEEAKDVAAVHAIEEKIQETWDTFFNVPRTAAEVEQVLWEGYPLHPDDTLYRMRVIDFHEYFPKELLTHRMLELSLLYAWRCGVRLPSDESRLWRRLVKRIFTPRLQHSLDLMGFMAYLAILARYSLYPPEAAIEGHIALATSRTVAIVVYALSKFLQDWSLRKLPYLLAAAAFLLALPSSPHASDGSYIVILVTLSLHILELHVPFSPSPLYLFPFEQALPLAALVWKGFSTMYIPILALFLPTTLLVFFLLSVSLSDIAAAIPLVYISASPLEARTAFLLLLVTLLFLLICSVGMLILTFPFVCSQPASTSSWDRYSESLGLDARRAFIRTVLDYMSPSGRRALQPFVKPPLSQSNSTTPSWMFQMRKSFAVGQVLLRTLTVGILPLLLLIVLLFEALL